MRLYHYVGPAAIRRRVEGHAVGRVVTTPADVLAWIRESGQERDHEGLVSSTFVIDAEGRLRIEDYGSEHVACAGGGPVRSAGVAWFAATDRGLVVARITNESTGFCPEPESWPAVESALDTAGIAHPGGFERPRIFRRCPACGQRNVVKDGWFHCAVCDARLPSRWNFAKSGPEEAAG